MSFLRKSESLAPGFVPNCGSPRDNRDRAMRWKLGSRGWQQCCARPKIVAAAVCALLVFLSRTTLARDKDDFRALYGWTCEQGRLNKIQKVGADLLGIPATSDIPALRKSYQDDSTKVIYSFYIFQVNGVPKMALFRLTRTLNVLWLVSEDGGARRAAEANSSGHRPVPVDRYRDYFIETKDYLLEERRKAVAEKPLTGTVRPFLNFPGNDNRLHGTADGIDWIRFEVCDL
jgi:hypothetical protein